MTSGDRDRGRSSTDKHEKKKDAIQRSVISFDLEGNYSFHVNLK